LGGVRVGDASFDLVTLLFYGYRDAKVRKRLLGELRERFGQLRDQALRGARDRSPS